MDSDYSMSQDYNAQGWPTFVVVDGEGLIQFHGFDSDRNLAGLRQCLQKILRAKPKDPKQKLVGGVVYPESVLASRIARRDRSPRLVFDRQNQGYLVYHSNAEGQNAVYLRQVRSGGQLDQATELSAPGVESYAADCVVDTAGALWFAWCGKTDRYFDILVQSQRQGEKARAEQLTMSDDDAMSPRLAAGPDGSLVITYYKWARLNGISRDRNIFARAYDPARRTWNPEVEISPPQPTVEDHTDPDVAVDAKGQAWIVWSYDYHPQLFRKPADASQPTIFAAKFSGGKATDPWLVGATEKLRHAIDLFPSVALDSGGALWCAWDCSEPHRSIQLARHEANFGGFRRIQSFGRALCSTPELSPAQKGLLLLAWSERAPVGGWQGKVALLKDGKALGTVTVVGKGDVLFPQAQQSPDGQYWVTYERSDDAGAEVICEKLDKFIP